MAADPLFRKEEAVIAQAEAVLASAGAADRAALGELLKAYKKLLKNSKRLMYMSDRIERDFAAMAEKQRLAVEEIGRKNAELEALSAKLSKYLSPQVYNSIFTGQQEVSLASRRKKLTVFFSDIAGFAETTDQMESEDLTQLVNHYLTEMSKVASDYGATIDKFIGDAIMIFFGDPETRGVKQDALSCVRMAIVMQQRMRELAGDWRDSGIKNPLRCRIGINTGYCTVGNFGSDDRMDYTILGGGVNLASRLEHQAEPDGILISYETYVHVHDEVACEAAGEIQIKGFAYPVSAYRVIGLHAELDDAQRPVRADLPHLSLQADPKLMTGEQRSRAAALLLDLAKRLDADEP